MNHIFHYIAPDSALCLFMLSISILGLGFLWRRDQGEKLVIFVMVLATAVLYLALNSLVGLLTGLHYSYAWGSFSRMELRSALFFLILSLSVLLLLVRRSWNHQFNSATIWVPVGINSFFLLTFSFLFHVFVEVDTERINEISKGHARVVAQKVRARHQPFSLENLDSSHFKNFGDELGLSQGYSISVTHENEILFSNRPPQSLMIKHSDPAWSQELNITLGTQVLTISVTPNLDTLRKEASFLPLFILIAGYLISMLFGLVGFFAFAYREARRKTLKDLRWVNAILEGSDLAVISVDTDGIVRSFNPRAESLLGYKAADVLGLHTPAIWHDKTEIEKAAENLTQWYQTRIDPGLEVFMFEARRGIIQKAEWTLIRKDGGRRTGYLSVHALKDLDGEITGFVGIVEDITEQKAQLEQIRVQQQKLIQSAKMASLGEMAAGIAHEVNNPLAIISTKVQLIRSQLERGKLDETKVTYDLDRIDTTIHRIAGIVQGLRNFARDSESDPFTEVELGELMEETLDLCRQRISAKGVRLDLFLPETPLYFNAKGTLISQVLLNLLNNSLDAIHNLPDKWIRISVKDQGKALEFSVSDCGPGIPAHIQEKIMQPFFTTKEVGQGTGLGLSISQGIVNQHGGQLGLDAKAPNTTFVFDILKDP